MSQPVLTIQRNDTGSLPWPTESLRLAWTGGTGPFQVQARVDLSDASEPWQAVGKPTLKQELIFPNPQTYDLNGQPMRNDRCFFRVQSEITMPAPAVTRANDVNTVSWEPPEQ